MRLKQCGASLLALIALSLSAHATFTSDDASTRAHLDPAQRLAIAQEAQRSYDAGMAVVRTDPQEAHSHFAQAASGFQRVVDSGVANGDLYYNLGNALVQSGEVGRGIGAYLNANALLPSDERISSNLAHARSLVAGARTGEPQTGLLDRASGSWKWLSLSTRSWGAAIAWLLVWLVVAAGVTTKWTTRVPWRLSITAAAAVCAALALTVGVDQLRHELAPPGVLIADQVAVRKGNGDGFALAFTEPLGQGMEFTLVEERPGWYLIQLASGQSGWVKSSDAVVAGRTGTTVQ